MKEREREIWFSHGFSPIGQSVIGALARFYDTGGFDEGREDSVSTDAEGGEGERRSPAASRAAAVERMLLMSSRWMAERSDLLSRTLMICR